MAFRIGSNYEGCFIVSFQNSFNHAVWSHEACHILLGGQGGNLNNHYSQKGDLMRAFVVYPDGNYLGSFSQDTKRLSKKQEGFILKSKFIQ